MTAPIRHAGLGAICALAILLAGCGLSSSHGSSSTAQPTSTASSVVTVTASTPVATTIPAQGIAAASDPGEGLASLTRPFSAQSPWNTSVTNAPVAANSGHLIALAQERFGVVQGNNLEQVTTGHRTIHSPLYINTSIWTDPILVSSTGQPTRLICRQVNLPPPNNDCGDGWEVHELPIPRTGYPKPQYDGWLTVIDSASGFAYDFWRARLSGSTMTYQFMRRWNLSGPGFLPPGYPGARGSGLPLFAGEILPEDIESGQIRHALAISLPGPAATFYVQPASTTDGNGEFGSLPEGSRIRLKASFSTGAALRALPGRTNQAAARAIITALKTYGAIVVDRSRVPTLYAVPDFDWNQPLRSATGRLLAPDGHTPLPQAQQSPGNATPLLSGNELFGLRPSDFEVVQLPPLLEFPPPAGGNPAGGLNGVPPQPVAGQSAGTGSEISSATPTPGVGDGSETP